MSSSFVYPDRLMHKLTGDLWFPRSKDATESRYVILTICSRNVPLNRTTVLKVTMDAFVVKPSLSQLEREEEAYEAKMKGIADFQVALPIGVTPAILTRHEKKLKELLQSDAYKKSNDMATTFQPVWNNRRQLRQQQQLKSPPIAADSPHSVGSRMSHTPLSEFSFALSTPRGTTLQCAEYDYRTPQQTPPSSSRSNLTTAGGGPTSSYNLDSSREESDGETWNLDTPRSRMSTSFGSGLRR